MAAEMIVAEDERPEVVEPLDWNTQRMMKEWRQAVARTHIFYRYTRDGRVQCVLTLSFAGNTTMRFAAECDPRTIIALMREQHPEVSGFSLKKLAKGVGKIAKSVASTKVFQLATKALSVLAPIAGPLAPALLGAGAALSATTKLLAAHKHAATGNKAAAAALVKSAADDAAQNTPPATASPAGSTPHVLNAANEHAQKIYTLLLRPA